MSRSLVIALAVGCLATAPGCSSCFGSNNCRRPSFMEFRGGGCGLMRRNEPQMAPCGAPACAPTAAPACDPCGQPAPCCEGGTVMPGPGGAVPVVSEPGTFS